jgi:Na+/H+-dicarboxylate symporter
MSNVLGTKSNGKKSMPLHIKVLIGFVVGITAGILAHQFAADAEWLKMTIKYVADPGGQLFLRLLFMLVLPLMFSALVLGVAELGDIASLGKLGWKTLMYTAVVTGLAVSIGIIAVNLVKPGVGVDLVALGAVGADAVKAKDIVSAGGALNGLDLLLNIVPKNVILAATDDKQKLGIIFFALMIGIGLVMTPTPATQKFKEALQGLFEICMKLIGLFIKLAPYAVACLMFSLIARLGWDALVILRDFTFTVLVALALHAFVVLPLWVRFMGKMNPIQFFKHSEEALLTAFATASSTATLPITLRVAEENLKLPRKISRFVLTVGASANHHGTALFEGVTVLFLAQAFGMDLSLSQQVVVLFLCILGGIGTSGVPSGSLPVIAMILGFLHIPPESIGIILGVNTFLDMCRTSVNVAGDLATAVVVAHQTRDSDVPENLPEQSNLHG